MNEARKENMKKNQRKVKEKFTTTVENDARNLCGTVHQGVEKKGKMVTENASDEDVEYEVEAVADHKIENGISYFLIKWKGYDSASSTWEPENTLSCPDLIAKFKKSAKRPMSKGRNPRKRPKHIAQHDPSQEWEVEKIIDAVADKNGGHIFRIRWKGYKPASDTWEPEANLNCGNLIEKFLKKRESEEALEHKELREAPKRTTRFVTDTFGRRSSKRNSGKSRAVYYDAE